MSANGPNWKEEIAQRIGEMADQVDSSILEELAQHLEARFEELQSYDAVMAEWSAADLRNELARIKQRRSPPQPGNPVSGLWGDVRFGVRQLRLSPGFTAVAVLSLALGIGANAAIFQLLDALRLRSLPVENPQELVNVQFAKIRHTSGSFRGDYPQSTYALWQQVRKQSQGFSGLLAWGRHSFDLAPSGQSRYTHDALWVSGDFFQVLGVHALLGRVFSAADDTENGQGCRSPGVVVSHAFWQREFGGDPTIIGRKISLNRVPLEIVGVTPPGFYGVEVGRSYDLAVPRCGADIFASEQLTRRDVWWLVIMGRLKPGWTVERASAQLAAVSPAITQAALYEKWNDANTKDFLEATLGAFPAAGGISQLREGYADPLKLLLLIAGLVLLIACANLANLLLARAAARQKEIAVRLALGASQARLIRQLLVESFLLAAAGSLAGALLARNLSRLLVAFLSTEAQHVFVDLGTNWRVFLFLAGTAILTCLLFGLVPALRAARTAPVEAMRGVGRGISESRQGSHWRHALLVSQMSLSLVLLVGSLLFIRSLENLLSVDAGFQQSGLLVTEYNFSDLHLAPKDRLTFRRSILERTRAIPGAESVATATVVPLSGDFSSDQIQMDGAEASVGQVRFSRVSPGYFKTVGAQLLAGRDFDARDQPGGILSTVVTQTFVRQLSPNQNPLGRRFRIVGDKGEAERIFEIVGVVKDAKYFSLREEFAPLAYTTASQEGLDRNWDNLVIRSSQPLSSLLPGIGEVMRQASPQIAYQLTDFEAQVRESLLQERLMAGLSSAFGILALVLTTVGLYGVISFTVARRTQEIGIRMALGATRSRIAALILREAAWLLAAGLAAGAALALYVLNLAEKMLYGLAPQDPWSFTVSAFVLAAVAAVASYLPARRAARLDPMTALREE